MSEAGERRGSVRLGGATTGRDRILIGIVLAAFTALSLPAVLIDGLPGTIGAITHNWSSLQIYVDLVLAVLVICVWMHADARAAGRNPWPWIVAAFVVGMFSPLVYLLTRPGASDGEG
jgi:RsiW-degrading membrane proteinase PrsW (M82 family)